MVLIVEIGLIPKTVCFVYLSIPIGNNRLMETLAGNAAKNIAAVCRRRNVKMISAEEDDNENICHIDGGKSLTLKRMKLNEHDVPLLIDTGSDATFFFC